MRELERENFIHIENISRLIIHIQAIFQIEALLGTLWIIVFWWNCCHSTKLWQSTKMAPYVTCPSGC